jgi:LCP family protein required for cell wall assembly
VRKVIVAVLASLLLLALAAVGVAYWQASSAIDQLHAGAKGAVVAAVKPELHRAPNRPLVELPPEPSAQTILLIGSDHRWEGGTGARSDTIMLARVQPDRHRIALLSIPRDLYVEIPGHGHDRINMAFRYGGERLLTRVVRDTLGVEIDHFVEVDFHGFKDVVSALGGVWFPVDQRYFNENVGTAATNYANIDLQPGYQKLTGSQALAYARYRHDDSDLYRAARQQLVIREALRQALADKLDLLRLRRLARDFAQATTSDVSSLGEVWSLANALRDARSVVRLTVSGSDLVLYGADYVSAGESELKTAVARWLGVRRPGAAKPPRQEAVSPPPALQLASDYGRAKELLRPLVPAMRRCVPTELPVGYRWPDGAARSYVLDGHPAIALYATAGSGRSALWTFTTWQDPPILDAPRATRQVGCSEVEVWTESGAIRQLAWRVGATRVWLTNTLRNDLSPRQMLALAGSCTAP